MQASSLAEELEFTKTTYTYKKIGELNIRADVHRHQDQVSRPVVVWLHGGALIIGNRTAVPQQILDLCQKEGFVLVSLDYRLAPEAKLPEIVSDLKDGLKWIRESGPELFAADTSRLVVAGASAGGYLALMSGIVDESPPTAIVSYWGFGNIIGEWTNSPSESYRKGKLITKDAACAGVGKEVLTNSNKTNGAGRATFFLYLKQTGLWTREVSGLDPVKDAEKLKPYCPVRNVSAKFPPTMFLHGTADKDVPVGQSIEMSDELKRHGVDREVITIEGGGHGLWGGDKQLIEKAFQRSLQYIREHLVPAK
jgi:acetyl esterase/lipase